MRKMIWKGLAGAVAVYGGVASAQNAFDGADIFVAGEAPVLDNWSPGTSTALQLKNDGTSGDTTASDTLWSVDVAVDSGLAASGARIKYKVAQAGWAKSWPGSDAWTRYVPGNMKFVFDTTTYNDRSVPDPDGTNVKGFVYTVPSPVLAGDAVRVVGSLVSELGGNDWDPASDAGRMNDSGTSGDLVAGDGVYTLAFTGIPANSYEFKVVLNGTYDLQVNTNGFATDGGNFSATVGASTDNVKILFDAKKGRVRIQSDSPLANPGPPFFATSDAWGTGLTSGTQLFDNGTNGDITANDGIHSRRVVTTAAGAHVVKVKQGFGTDYPATGAGYPIDIVTTGQPVLVQFDTNTYNDGFLPNTRFLWTDPASRRVATYVQAVGNFQIAFGGATDWNNNDTFFRLVDSGTNGDLAVGDGIFSKAFTAFAPVTNGEVKAIGEQGSWQYQFGGTNAGYTKDADNPKVIFNAAGGSSVTFQVDSVTGRVGVGTTLPVLPASRFAPATPSASASDWQLFN